MESYLLNTREGKDRALPLGSGAVAQTAEHFLTRSGMPDRIWSTHALGIETNFDAGMTAKTLDSTKKSK
jgi:hypothetical protein